MATKKSSRSAAPAVKARKTAASKSPARKTSASKSPARKSPARKPPARKAPASKRTTRGAKARGGGRGQKTQLGNEADTSWMKTWPRIVARAWSDPAFMERLKSAPADVFKEYNLSLFPDFEYSIRQGTGRPLVTLSLPHKPGSAGSESVGDITHEDGRARPKSCTNTCAF
ncbi:hypothetical protein JRI60_14620 [Archangium violaceum]|uniref:hypothetical protein n=1 Tax=Archangium violaceum TaxID=83451 RepID=UPI0019509187|nr:hypothetical protein [Archangium violaceum]QRO00158.1 hypothetical protein JRI60_14620 [Archangium violaceum]